MDLGKVKEFAEELGEKLLEQLPAIVLDVAKDHADAPHETQTALAATAVVQASDVAKSVAPGDTATIDGLTAIANLAVKALKTPPPVAPAA